MGILPSVIGLVGPIRAGKTTTAKYLVDRYGFTLASNSEILKRILTGMGIVPTRTNLSSLGDAIFEVLGNDVIAKQRLENLHLGPIVVDGIRYNDELERYSQHPDFKLLGLTADPELRFARTLRNSEELKDLGISQEEFSRLSLSRSELNVPELLSRADALVTNVGSIELLHANIDKILEAWSR